MAFVKNYLFAIFNFVHSVYCQKKDLSKLNKKRATPAGRCSPIAAFRATKHGITARSILSNFLWYKKIATAIFAVAIFF